MHENNLKKAVNDFLLQRINECGMRENLGLQDASEQFESAVEKLKSTLTTEQKQALIEVENAASLMNGETTQTYYRAGFSDAIEFILGWRDGEWN